MSYGAPRIRGDQLREQDDRDEDVETCPDLASPALYLDVPVSDRRRSNVAVIDSIAIAPVFNCHKDSSTAALQYHIEKD